jgi:hypothetical protein
VGHGEARAFRAVNGLRGSLYGPVWVTMQLGMLLAHDRELAGCLLAGGMGTWALSELVKQMVRPSRPAALASGTRIRGRDSRKA